MNTIIKIFYQAFSGINIIIAFASVSERFNREVLYDCRSVIVARVLL
jgi:hypothetical protein